MKTIISACARGKNRNIAPSDRINLAKNDICDFVIAILQLKFSYLSDIQ